MAVDAIERWQARWPAWRQHESVQIDQQRMEDVLSELEHRLSDNYPFFHPDYAGQMLKPPSPAAVVGYLAAMLINPNNHALDGGPATSALEREAVAALAAMFRLPKDTLGHLTSSGTIANLEALFVARELNPGAAIAFSEESHYTHERMCGLLGVRTARIRADGRGRMDLDDLERALRTERIGTVVLTAGTTSLGAVDPIADALRLRGDYGVRFHVDAAYGGFFAIPAWSGSESIPIAPFRAIAECDSVVVDPHKHGLQPYGCGCVLVRDPSVGRFYKHDSPFTYFSSADLHLGEISLECSRAGAAAAALWTTLQLFPLTDAGLGAVVMAGRRAALRWSELLRSSTTMQSYQQPELDIVTYFPIADGLEPARIDRASQRVYDAAMQQAEPVYVALARVAADAMQRRHPMRDDGTTSIRILRSVLMKPEHEYAVDGILARLEAISGAVAPAPFSPAP
jgi:glutamate/tyrosine decarboxylase-like PLP-dependent enzyme